MAIGRHFRSASTRLLGHRRRAALAVAGFALAAASMVVAGAIGAGERALIAERGSFPGAELIIASEKGEPALPRNLLGGAALVEVATHAPPSSYLHIKPYPEIVTRAERADADIAAVAPVVLLDGVLRSRTRREPVVVRGVDPARERKLGFLARAAGAPALDGLARQPNGVILGAGLARRLGTLVGREIILATASSPATALTVVGILRSESPEIDGGACWVPLPLAQSLRGMPPAAITALAVRLRDGADRGAVIGKLRAATGYAVTRLDERGERLARLHRTRHDLFAAAALAALIAAAVGLATMLLRDIVEDRAARRSASPISLLLEGGLVGAVGGLFGLAIGAIVASWLDGAPLATSPEDAMLGLEALRVAHPPEVYLVALGAALLAALAAGAPPALRAAALQRRGMTPEGA